MRRHVAGIVAVTTAIVLGTFLPFLPGSYDGLAWALSGAAHVFGIVGLLLVPIGVAWLAYELRKRGAPAVRGGRDRSLVLAWVALVATSIVGAVVALATLPTSFATGVIMLLLGGYGVRKAMSRLRMLRRSGGRALIPVSLYLVVVPLVVTLSQVLFHGAAVESSRNTAAENAGVMIAEIERYREVNGRYPASLVAVWPDYLPSVIGVRRYEYEPSGGDSFNLSFEQFRFHPIGTREFVVYNPRDDQTMVSHTGWRMIAPDLEGHYAVHDASRPHWKYFWFD